MKKKLIIIVSILVMAVVAVFLTISIIKKENTNLPDINENLNVNEVGSLSEQSIVIPEFTVVIDGNYDLTVTDYDLAHGDVQVYEFDANIQTSWETKKDHYIGVKLDDVLKLKGVTNYDKLTFRGAGNITVEYEKKELDFSKMFLVFFRNGSPIDDNPVNLLSVNYKYKYSVEGLIEITAN